MPGTIFAKKFKLKGPNSTSSAACSSGNLSLAEAYYTIKEGDAKVMVAGAVDVGINPYILSGFSKLKLLNKSFNKLPAQASRPFDEKRDGIVLGSGAGALLLEDLDHAIERGAKIYAEVIGFGCNQEVGEDLFCTQNGIERALEQCLNEAEISREDISLINLHGSSSKDEDATESEAVYNVFSNSTPYLMATKGNIGHTLAASSALDSVFTLKAMEQRKVPPILNLKNPINENLNFCTSKQEKVDIEYAINNSLSLGGISTAVLFKKYQQS